MLPTNLGISEEHLQSSQLHAHMRWADSTPHVCVPTPRHLCLVSPRAGAATQPDIQPGWGAWSRRNSPCQTRCWHMTSKQTAPWGWPGAVKTPKKSTTVGTRLLLVLHATIPSLLYSIFLGAFFQRDLRSQLSAGAEHTVTSLLQGHPKTLQLSNSLFSAPSKPSISEVRRQHRQNNIMKAIKHDGDDGSSLAGDCGSAVTTENNAQTSKLYLSSRKGYLSYCDQCPQAEEMREAGACPSMGYIHSQGNAGCGGTAFPTVSHPRVSPWVPLHVCALIPS